MRERVSSGELCAGGGEVRVLKERPSQTDLLAAASCACEWICRKMWEGRGEFVRLDWEYHAVCGAAKRLVAEVCAPVCVCVCV